MAIFHSYVSLPEGNPHFWWFLAQGLASFGARWPRPWDLAHRHSVQGPATTCLEDPGALAVRLAIFFWDFLGCFSCLVGEFTWLFMVLMV